MSEAEPHFLKVRMRGGVINKASVGNWRCGPRRVLFTEMTGF
jgi:hypothetical protein